MSVMKIAWLVGLAGKVFLGQAYPSGNAYMQPFMAKPDETLSYAERPPLATWPASLTLHCLYANGCTAKDVGHDPRQAKRDSYFVPELERKADPKTANVVTITYDLIPAHESMEDRYNAACRLTSTRNAAWRYADGDDYFATMSDYCFFDDAIMRYSLDSPPKATSYQVIGLAKGLQLVKVTYAAPQQKRPASPPSKPAAQVSSTDCSTTPATLTDAIVLLTIKTAGHGQSLRLSSYEDPGCAGHLREVYVLDTLKDDKVTGTFFATRNKGLL